MSYMQYEHLIVEQHVENALGSPIAMAVKQLPDEFGERSGLRREGATFGVLGKRLDALAGTFEPGPCRYWIIPANVAGGAT